MVIGRKRIKYALCKDTSREEKQIYICIIYIAHAYIHYVYICCTRYEYEKEIKKTMMPYRKHLIQVIFPKIHVKNSSAIYSWHRSL